ncbi:hypothetical protein BO70DRAFT_365859 [Aspergillus heteromorphus CBS 117.55]|uniref:Uncharacterized protein n=1 Tax=Aspergillus heteromorphus CBS 117.55 TaxID=1448321 RepID=A0A317V5K4_9EURO|nr:uncharacterized protein BO70DRAFT_365859 [Aspergillus heteromorphus CBS 117.55]PWY69584.1 hypothetical protein BO70DRAFT_365859 [Aspergillus heteromorphus CBS 117.55]
MFHAFKCRSDLAFFLACDKLTDVYTTLRVLHVRFCICKWPIHLEIGKPALAIPPAAL